MRVSRAAGSGSFWAGAFEVRLRMAIFLGIVVESRAGWGFAGRVCGGVVFRS